MKIYFNDKQKSRRFHDRIFLAETVGFEPTGRLITDQTISSRSRYDLFDTSPYYLNAFRAENKCKKNMQERINFSISIPPESVDTKGFCRRRRQKTVKYFESGPLWPLRYASVNIFNRQGLFYQKTALLSTSNNHYSNFYKLQYKMSTKLSGIN